ncbi:chloride channel protein [Methylobacterium thuringiense]|uniref:Voltage-gated ClC-type chloride channel ClcB n=1 Tax=Methylobacterium thuringiense TaxID=1003091 RepID=A0ABQ4TQN4_9HYPH|nr:chloride channel protein [Methylobacterium thuringiense]GJE57174.1 Voltage-gated ClC-type chloride channel ClcB [Methylobacterium thuringiense]
MKSPTLGAARGLIRVPERLRALVRGSEAGLVVLAAVIGCVGGFAVVAMGVVTQLLREALYHLPHGARLSAMTELPTELALAGPALGGALLGLLGLAMARRRGGQPRRAMIDPIEANALHGGRMSLRDSVTVAVQNVISNGCGASVGLEAGYTQIAGGLASRAGIAFGLRRSDLRTLVGCGSAAAIGAAFGSPLTGAFYAYELIIGTYTIATLAPVVAAAFCGSLVARSLVAQAAFVDVRGLAGSMQGGIAVADTLACLALGFVCAGLGVAIMRGVTLVERGFRRTGIPAALRPLLGGLCVGGLALATTPQVLSGGHGALHFHLSESAASLGAGALAGLLAAKAAASAISIGAGFRGGLFFASLFLGALAGKLFYLLAPGIDAIAMTATAYAIVGMAALAVAIVGGPLTMTFLALEMTGSFPLAGLVLAAVIAASLTVRKTFGYSFATWRFHLRGESIRSAHDIGWIRSLTVGRLMRKDVRTVPLDTPLAVFLREHPLGSPSLVVVTDARDRYAGIVLVPEAHAQAGGRPGEPARLADVARHGTAMLFAGMNAKEAMAAFDRTESEALAVVDGPDSLAVIGLLTESHTLRRYSEELDRQRQAVVGETS